MYPIGFQLSWDLNIFVHLPGEQIWLSYINFPLGVSFFQLDVNNTTGMRATDLSIKENEIFVLSKPEAPCLTYILEVELRVSF
jgi:hypothetical protein